MLPFGIREQASIRQSVFDMRLTICLNHNIFNQNYGGRLQNTKLG